jgi:hypothetical protein
LIMENGAPMERRRLLPFLPLAVVFIVGAGALSRFSHGVRGVNAVGLAGGGCAIGVGFALLVLSLKGRLKE